MLSAVPAVFIPTALSTFIVRKRPASSRSMAWLLAVVTASIPASKRFFASSSGALKLCIGGLVGFGFSSVAGAIVSRGCV